jgi:hypothetical protein
MYDTGSSAVNPAGAAAGFGFSVTLNWRPSWFWNSTSKTPLVCSSVSARSFGVIGVTEAYSWREDRIGFDVAAAEFDDLAKFGLLLDLVFGCLALAGFGSFSGPGPGPSSGSGSGRCF